jgi:protein-arginine kinase activator protein McsA
MLLPEDDIGYKQDDLKLDAVRAQRSGLIRPGDYLCQKCQTQFPCAGDQAAKLQCPKCKNTSAETLTPIYTEEDPKRDEMLGKDEFSAGD